MLDKEETSTMYLSIIMGTHFQGIPFQNSEAPVWVKYVKLAAGGPHAALKREFDMLAKVCNVGESM